MAVNVEDAAGPDGLTEWVVEEVSYAVGLGDGADQETLPRRAGERD